MPDPSDFDTEDEFLDACILERVEEGDEQDQAVAACNSIWEDHVKDNVKHGSCNCDGDCACGTGPSAHALPRMHVQTENIRTETLDGKTFRVAPVIPAVGDNVMNEALVPVEEWARSLPSWNGRPLPVNHPEHNGMPISANDPQVLERTNVGFLFNARLDEDGKFRAELWIDEGKAERIAPDVLNALDEGRLEVSTAYFADDEVVNGEHGGKTYRVVHRNLRPDHVALLPNTLGACSWEDGCGAPRLNTGGTMNVRTPSFDGTTRGEWSRPSFNEYVNAIGAKAERVADLSAEHKAEIANMTLLGNAEADSFEDLTALPVVEPGSRKLNKNALDAVLDGRGSQAEINANALKNACAHARDLLVEHFDHDIASDKGLLKRAMDFVFRRNRWNADASPDTNVTHGVTDTRQLERDLVEALEDELDQPVFVETVVLGDELSVVYEALGDMDEPSQLLRRGFTMDDNGDITLAGDVQEVQRVVEYEPVSNDSGGTGHPEAKSSPEDNSMDDRIKELISNDNAPFGEADQERLQAFEEATLDSLVNAYREDDGGDGQHQHSAGEGADDVSGDLNTQQDGETVEQFIERAPAGLRDQLRTMRRQHEQHRDELVKAITANERNVFGEDELRAMDTEKLEKLERFAKQPSYEGRGSANRDGGPETQADKAYTNDEVPRLNRGSRRTEQQ